jgi:hypothetical protein
VLSFALCLMFAADFAQTLVFYFYFADKWYWKLFLGSLSIEMGFLSLFDRRDISVLVSGITAAALLLVDSLNVAKFVSLSVASFIVHYLIETLVNSSLRHLALMFYVPTVWLSQSMKISDDAVITTNAPVLGLFLLFGIQAVLKTFSKINAN